MKKILPLLLSLFAFVACDNVSNNNAEFVPIDTEAVTTECTITVEDPSTIVLSDGTWTIVEIVKSLNSKGSYKMDCTVEAKEGIYTITYAKLTETMDCTYVSDENIESMKNNGYSVTWNNDNTVTFSTVIPKEQLSLMEQRLAFFTISGADAKTNADNTKYVVVEESNDYATTILYYSKN